MKIQKMFKKQIDRPITGVIKVGQIAENDKKQELEEYVVTRELTKHFREFFDNYTRSVTAPTDEMGVWISGFFGSGKSHFLKILSYLLDNTVVDGKDAAVYFADKENLQSDPLILADIQRAAEAPTQAILFNIDSKSSVSAKSNSNAIVMVFNRVFNEKLGYDGANPALADLERVLDEEGNYTKFQDIFREQTGKEWLTERNKFRVIRGKVAKVLSTMGRMTEQEAMDWTKAATTSDYEIAIEDFAERVRQYIEKSGNRVVFLVDEIGQFISSNSNLMLNLQTMTEELGTRCRGKVWIIVTAQEDIDSMMENLDVTEEKKNDFSKIQGRFKTRLPLSSVNADEVIRERILKKNETGSSTLKALYESEETRIQNAVGFKGNGYEMKKYRSAEEFASVYPFLPYQFNLLADVLNAIRLNSSTGKHLSEGERSMLGACQQAAISVMEKEEGTLIPFYRFYDDLLKFLDHTHASVIQRAEDSERINPLHETDCFAVNVLKTLFLMKYIQGVPMTVDNILNFMVTDIYEDKAVLRHKVEDALLVLTRSLLISQIQDTYEFLTDEEQDINRAIRDRNISSADVITEITKMTFDSVYSYTRYRVLKFNGRYTFAYNQAVDNRPYKNNQNHPIGFRIITPKYVGNSGDGNIDDTTLTMMSARNHEVFFKLPMEQIRYYNEMMNALKIDDYLRAVEDPQKGKSTIIRTTKAQESGKSRTAALASLKEAIGNARIFINGQSVTDINSHDAVNRINDALGRLIENIYYKLSYIEAPKDEQDIKKIFRKDNQVSLTLGEKARTNANALKEVLEYIRFTTSDHSKISMKSLVDHFSQVPYGYTDSDTKWLAAILFKDGKISAMVDKEPISPFNREADELGNYFTSRRFDEKILFKGKQTIQLKNINACREVMKELFHRSETGNEPDKMMDAFQTRAKELIEDLNELVTEQRHEPDFPGQQVLSKVVRILANATLLNEEGKFYDWVLKEKENLLDLAEDLAPVKTFYSNENQRKIFKENGLYALRLYDSSKEHINNSKIGEVVEAIQSIVRHKTPYERIRKLPELYKEFMELYSGILDEKLEPVKERIAEDEQSVLNFITGQPYEKDVKAEIRNAFYDLTVRASEEKDISNLLGFKDKADSLCKRYLDQFTNIDVGPRTSRTVYPVEIAGKGTDIIRETSQWPSSSVQKTIKNLMARDVTSGHWVIRDKDDLNRYLEQIRERVEAELGEDIVVRIQF